MKCNFDPFLRALKNYRMSRDCFCFCKHQNSVLITTMTTATTRQRVFL